MKKQESMLEKPFAAKTGDRLINAWIAYRLHRSKPVHSGVRSMLIREKRPILSYPLLLPLGFRGIIKSAKRIFPAKVQLFLSVRING